MADQILNQDPNAYRVKHVFSTDDITGTFGGLTQGDVLEGETPIIDFTADPKVADGVNLYPINSEFGFNVYDFDQAVQKDFYLDPEYAEGWAGDLKGEGGDQLGLVVSDAPTDTFKTPAVLGTWLAGIGGSTVKASTEHYTVMQNILSDQRYPGDLLAEYPLDDELYVIGGDYDGMRVADVIPIVGDVNGDGVQDIKDVLLPNEATIRENIAASSDYSVTLKDDGKLLYRWGNTIKKPNDIRIETELPLPDEWKEPDADNGGLIPLFKVSMAELVTRHTITNNPNDQIRPEDFENESAIGQLPTYEILDDGKWVTTADYYAGDGTLYPKGTVLKDPALAEKVVGTALDQIGALSADLREGFTNAWYTTMDREPFEAVLNEDGTDYEGGPRWRLQPDKYGQDLPSVVIPQDPSLPPPPTKDEVKYEVGEDTQTVINLLDWELPVSPLSISAGWQNNSGTVSVNGLNMTENFDIAFYVKGDIKPATLYDTELVMSYDEIAISDKGAIIVGGEGNDYLVGQGGNTFTGDGGSTAPGQDLFVLNYGVSNNFMDIQTDSILDFQPGEDTIGLIELSVTALNFDQLVKQTVRSDGLHISLVGGFKIAILEGQTEPLTADDFLFVNRLVGEKIVGTDADEYLVGDDFNNAIFAGGGDDVLLGLAGEDFLDGGEGDDKLIGGDGNDALVGGLGADFLNGGTGIDTARYTDSASVTVDLTTGTGMGGEAEGDTLIAVENIIGSDFGDTLIGNHRNNVLLGEGGDDNLAGAAGNDILKGGVGADALDGGADFDTAHYRASATAVTIDLAAGSGSGGDADGDTLTSIERVVGSDFDDTLLGADIKDLLEGVAGNDILIGNGGDDSLNGGEGADSIDGGLGNDTAIYAKSSAAVQVNLGAGILSGGEAEGDTLTSIENVTGSDFDDTLVGDSGDNRLRGGNGDDVLDGGDGDDRLVGEAGDDLFIFNAGNDTIIGGDGADTALYVGVQADYDIVDNGAGSWVITDLLSSDVDTLTGIETVSFDDGFLIA